MPAGQSMQNSASNSSMSKQFERGDEDVPDSTHSNKNTSGSSEGGKRSQRGPGREV